MKRRDFLLATAAVAIPVTLAAPAARAAKRGGTLVFARYADSLMLDPTQTAQNADIWISLNLYDTLLQPTADGKGLQPGLAESHTISDSGTAITFKMRPDLKFADGSPITVGDVKWSLDRARAKDTGGEFGFLLAAIASVETPAPDTVVVTTTLPDPSILQALATFNAGIMSEKLMMAAPGATLKDKVAAFAEKPIGSGPFMMDSWRRNSEMVLKRNPFYWKKDAAGIQLPYLDAIKCVIIPDDATRVLKLRAGEVDLTEFVPYARVAELKAAPGINMQLFPAAQVHYFTMNNRPTLKDGTKNPLSDQRVRQALNYATNKPALSQIVTHGVGVPARSYMPMATPLAYGPAPLYPYDLAKAKALLAEAGYASGFEVTCMALAGSADDSAKLTVLQQMWSQVGVRLKIEQLENATRLARFNGGDFQMRTSLWTNDLNDPKQVTSIMAYYPTRQANRTGWNDPVLGKLFEDSEKEMDQAKRGAMYEEIQKRFFEAAPFIFGLDVPYPVALLNKVKGFVQIPLGNNIFVETWLDV